MIEDKCALLLLGSNGGNSLDVVRDSTLLLGVAVGEDDLGLNLLGLAREDDLAVVLRVLTTVLQVLDKDGAIGGSVNLLALADVRANREEGNLLVV